MDAFRPSCAHDTTGTRGLGISDFTSDFFYGRSSIEEGATGVELVRDDKIVASVCRAAEPKGSNGALSDGVGTGCGFTLAPGASLDDPALVPEEWEDAFDDL